MGALALLRRLIARVTETPIGRLMSGMIAPEEAGSLARRAFASAPQLAIADATTAFATPEWIQQASRVVQGDAEYLLLVVDSVHSWSEGLEGFPTEYETMNAALAALRAISASLSCSVLVISERNRAGMKTGG